MANPDLVRYVSEGLAQGSTLEQLSKVLVQSGWPEAEVTAAVAQAGSTPQASGGGSELGQVLAELKTIKDVLKQHNVRLFALEAGKPSLRSLPVQPMGVQARPMPDFTRAQTPAPVVSSLVPPKPHESMESALTGKWFAIIGIVAVIIGVGFFLKYAFDNDLIGVVGRVVMGVVSGLALLITGSVLFGKEKYRQYSLFLSGGGLALLYLSIFSAFNFYHLISQPTAFAFMVLVTAGGVAMSLLTGSDLLAGLSLFGGFLTPFLASTGVDNQLALFGYILILDLGFLVLSYFKKWHDLYLLNFIGTYLTFIMWYASYYNPTKLGPTFVFLTLFFLVFFLAPFLTTLARTSAGNQKDVTVTSINALIYFSLSYYLLRPEYHAVLGFFFVLGALVYLITAYIVFAVNRQDRYSVYALGAIGLVLLTLAIPMQLDRNFITGAWAVEALLLTWVGFRLKGHGLRVFADAVFIVMGIRLLVSDIHLVSLASFQPFINERFITFLAASLCLFAAAYLYHRNAADLAVGEQNFSAVLGVAANLGLLAALSLEVVSYFEHQIFLQQRAAQAPTDLYNQLENMRDVELTPSRTYQTFGNMRNLSLSVLWALYASTLLLVGIFKHSRAARVLALLLFGLVVLKVFLVDSAALSDLYRILSFISLGVILLIVSFLFYRYKDRLKHFLTE